MSATATATTLVYRPSDLVWHRTSLGRELWLSEQIIDGGYSTAYNAQLSKFGPGGGSPLHEHPYNHAFYFIQGTGSVQIDGRTWQVEPGTFVKVPAHEEHGIDNTGTEDLVFLVVYDPPNRGAEHAWDDARSG